MHAKVKLEDKGLFIWEKFVNNFNINFFSSLLCHFIKEYCKKLFVFSKIKFLELNFYLN